MQGDKVKLDGCNYLDPNMVNEKWSHFRLDKGDIVISTSASLDKIAEVDEEAEGAIPYTGLIRFKMFTGLSKKYFTYFIKSPCYMSQIAEQEAGAAIKHYGPTHLKRMVIPIPPVEEQDRIVAMIEKVLPSLREYSKKEETLDMLNNAFPEKLKKSILQQAVMGKLVSQDPNDEPASVLLERIRAEKDDLIKSGKLKKDKHESIIYRRDNSHYEKINDDEICIDDEVPFEIPNSWEWVRLGAIVSYQNGYAYSKSDYSKHDRGIPVIKSNNLMTLQVVINEKTNYIEEPTEKMLESQIREDDLLMCLSSQSENTEPLGKTAIFRLGIPALLNQRVLKMTAYYYPIVDWMYYAINSEYFHYTVSHRSGGSAQSNLKLEHVLSMLIPIPPICEQERIIDAIESVNRKISTL
jgi:type I restriction enzyme S subunit